MSLVLWSVFPSGNDGSFSVVCRLLTPTSSLILWCRRLAPCRFHPAFIFLEKNGEERRHGCGFKAVGGGLTGSGWDLGTVSIDLSITKSVGDEGGRGGSGSGVIRWNTCPFFVSSDVSLVDWVTMWCLDDACLVHGWVSTRGWPREFLDAWDCEAPHGLWFGLKVHVKFAFCSGLLVLCLMFLGLFGLDPLIK